MKREITMIVSLILIAAMIVTGCQGGSSAKTDTGTNEGGVKKDSAVFRTNAEPATLDPAGTNDSISQDPHYQLYDTLLRETKDGSLEAGLAESWDFSEDNTHLTFHLRKGVKFHNGDTLTAEDVAYSINRLIDSSYAKIITGSMDSAEAVDDSTVTLKLKYAYGPILRCMATVNTSIVSKKAVEADPEGFARNPVGTGPYKFKEWVKGDKIVFESFADYYRGEAPIKNITYKIIGDASTALVALEKGDVDILDNPSQTDRKNILENENLSFYECDAAAYVLIAFNNEEGRFTNKKLREAVSYAVDREAIIIGAKEGVASPVEAAMVPMCEEYPEGFKANPYDPEKAKELLTEAGYPDGLKVKMKTIDSVVYTKPTEVIQEQLRQIGIDVEIEIMERGAWNNDILANTDYEMTLWAVPITVIDADFATYSQFHSSMRGGNGNFTNCNIPELDKLLEEGRVCQPGDERKEIYRQVCQIIKDESVLVPLFAAKRQLATSKDLKGVYANPTCKYYLYEYSW